MCFDKMEVIPNVNKAPRSEVILDGLHLQLVGKLAVLTEFGVELSEQYRILYDVGNPESDLNILKWCQDLGKYKVRLIFIDEPSIKVGNLRFFCLKEVGVGIGKYGDWHWFTLDQLMICDEK